MSSAYPFNHGLLKYDFGDPAFAFTLWTISIQRSGNSHQQAAPKRALYQHYLENRGMTQIAACDYARFCAANERDPSRASRDAEAATEICETSS